jgi:predicted nucleotidyltransferase
VILPYSARIASEKRFRRAAFSWVRTPLRDLFVILESGLFTPLMPHDPFSTLDVATSLRHERAQDRFLPTTMNPLTVIQTHLAELVALGARRLGVFGSYARGEERDGSDVDVYVEFDDAKRTYDNFFALHERLENLLDRRVDLVTDKSLTETKARLILPTVRYAADHG